MICIAVQGFCARRPRAGGDNRCQVRQTVSSVRAELLDHAVVFNEDRLLSAHADRQDRLVVAAFGPLDAFVTANPYVARLLADDYPVLRPVDLVPPAERVPVDGTGVRREMARGEGWRPLVPPEVSDYIQAHGLDRRFRSEFGLETLALDAPPMVR